MKLTNKINVLDKGYVAAYSLSMGRTEFTELQNLYYNGVIDSTLLQIPQVHLEIKCPLFVQLNLSKYGIQTTSKIVKEVEAYVPTVDEINAVDLATSEEIQKVISNTTEALLLNPKGLQMDGCNRFISQLICPISMYNTIMSSGNLDQWIRFANQEHLPDSVEQYRKAVAELLLAEWNYLYEYIKK